MYWKCVLEMFSIKRKKKKRQPEPFLCYLPAYPSSLVATSLDLSIWYQVRTPADWFTISVIITLLFHVVLQVTFVFLRFLRTHSDLKVSAWSINVEIFDLGIQSNLIPNTQSRQISFSSTSISHKATKQIRSVLGIFFIKPHPPPPAFNQKHR